MSVFGNTCEYDEELTKNDIKLRQNLRHVQNKKNGDILYYKKESIPTIILCIKLLNFRQTILS